MHKKYEGKVDIFHKYEFSIVTFFAKKTKMGIRFDSYFYT